MKIKLLHPIPKTAYFGNEVLDLPSDQASDYVARGYALMIPETHQEEIVPVKAYVMDEETIKTTVRGRKRK